MIGVGELTQLNQDDAQFIHREFQDLGLELIAETDRDDRLTLRAVAIGGE